MDNKLVDQLLKTYQLIIKQEIGKGLTSKIYLCFDQNTLKQKILKLYNFNRHPSQKIDHNTINNRLLLQYKLQSKILTILQNNQGIVDIYQYGQYQPYGFIIMEYLSTGSLKDIHHMLLHHLQSPNNPTLQHQYARIVRIILLKLLLILKTLQQNNIIHRDIKLQNILFDANYNIKLIDFGAAKIISNFNVLNNQQLANQIKQIDKQLNGNNDYIVGSVNYLCPDALAPKSTRHISTKIDTWAFGIIMYYLLSDTFPFRHAENNNISSIMKTVRTTQIEYGQKVRQQQKEIIGRCLQKDVSKRISVEQLLKSKYFSQIESNSLKIQIDRFMHGQKYEKKILYRVSYQNIQCGQYMQETLQNNENQKQKNRQKYKNINVRILQNQLSNKILCVDSRIQKNSNKNQIYDKQIWQIKKTLINIRIYINNIQLNKISDNILKITNKHKNHSLIIIFNHNTLKCIQSPLEQLIDNILQINHTQFIKQ